MWSKWECNVAIQWVVCFSVTEGSCEEMSAEASFRFFSFVPKHPLPLVVMHSSACAGRHELYNSTSDWFFFFFFLFKSQTQKLTKKKKRRKKMKKNKTKLKRTFSCKKLNSGALVIVINISINIVQEKCYLHCDTTHWLNFRCKTLLNNSQHYNSFVTKANFVFFAPVFIIVLFSFYIKVRGQITVLW